MENEKKKENALVQSTKADKSIRKANHNSGKQDNYNKPAAINQEVRTHLSKILEIDDNLTETSISADYARFMICSVLSDVDEMSGNADIILFNFKNIVTMVNIALDYIYKVNQSISDIETQVSNYIDSLRSVCNEC